MANGNARLLRFARADHIPARRIQVHPIAQIRRFLVAVRIAHHDGIAAHGQLAADQPIVAAAVFMRIEGAHARFCHRAFLRFGQLGQTPAGSGGAFGIAAILRQHFIGRDLHR